MNKYLPEDYKIGESYSIPSILLFILSDMVFNDYSILYNTSELNLNNY